MEIKAPKIRKVRPRRFYIYGDELTETFDEIVIVTGGKDESKNTEDSSQS
jgi:hypothetical protein